MVKTAIPFVRVVLNPSKSFWRVAQGLFKIVSHDFTVGMTVSHGRSTFLGKTIFSETFFCREDYRPRPLSGLGSALIPRTVKRVRYYNIIFFFFLRLLARRYDTERARHGKNGAFFYDRVK